MTNLIRSYFNFYKLEDDKQTDMKRSRRMRIRFKRLSTNRVFTNKAEIKHTNTKITVTSNVYNAYILYLYNMLKEFDSFKPYQANESLLARNKKECDILTNKQISIRKGSSLYSKKEILENQMQETRCI